MLDREAVRNDLFFRESTSHLDTLDALVDYAMVLWSERNWNEACGAGVLGDVRCV